MHGLNFKSLLSIRFYQHAQTGVGQGTANSASNDPVILTSATSVPS